MVTWKAQVVWNSVLTRLGSTLGGWTRQSEFGTWSPRRNCTGLATAPRCSHSALAPTIISLSRGTFFFFLPETNLIQVTELIRCLCSRLESSDIEHITLKEPSFPRQTVRRHSNCVLSVKFAPSKKWFLSTGKDGLVVGWKNPTCAPLFEEKEGASILCTEISACGNYVVTGSGDCRATLYSTI